jgi:hypothetical protein
VVFVPSHTPVTSTHLPALKRLEHRIPEFHPTEGGRRGGLSTKNKVRVVSLGHALEVPVIPVRRFLSRSFGGCM